MPEDRNNETKIVKAENKKSDANDKSSKVQIRAVDKAIIEAQQKKAKDAKAAPAAKKPESKTAPAAVPPAGKPMAKSSTAAARPFPMGKPMPKNAVPKKKSDVPQNLDEKPVKEEKPAEEVLEEIKPVQEAAEPAEKPEVKPEVIETKAEESGEKKEEAKAEAKAEKAEKKEEPAAAEVKETEAKAEKPEKKADKTEAKAEKKEAPAKEHTKAADKPVKKEEKPAEIKKDYLPSIGVKIIRTAADEKKLEDEQKAKAKAREEERKAKAKAESEKKSKDRSNNNSSNGKKKAVEFKGRNNNASGNKPEGGDSPRRPKGPKSQDGKVVAYTAPAGGDNRGRKGNKDKDKNRKDNKVDKYNVELADLEKTGHKKHSKYKEKVEVVEENPILENLAPGSVVIDVPITLAGFCEQIEKSTSQAIMALMKMGIMANINQNLDEETAVLLGMELGVNVVVNKTIEEEPEEGIDLSADREADLEPRPPVITVMGHVDHGKTSLLDAIRNTNVTEGEAGGITQHIGASEVVLNGQKIVFLDTPGHEAFTAMRARGAHITDIAVLVVAADDSVMPQTIESISHAKAAGVPIIVAINKIDKPGANIDNVKTDLANNGILVEDWGGDVISVPVSAKTGQGITQLLEMILLQAEVLELKANPNRLAKGTVIEARLDKNKGPVATLLVMNGTLQAGAAVVAGTAAGRIRVMTNYKGEVLKKAGPARAVEITGLADVPEAGDEFYMVKDEKTAKEIAARRKEKLREEVMAKNASVSLEKLFSQLEEGETRDLNLIIKADVQGSVGALEQSLEKLHNENVRVRIIHSGVGTVTEGDVMLAETSNAVIIGFNVRPSSAVTAQADAAGVEIRTYRIIYEIIEDIEAAMKGMLDPLFKEVVLGSAEVRETFKVPNVGIIAGCYVTDGKITRSAQLRLVRDGIVIHEGNVSSLKRFKDDVREVATGYECGIGIEKFNDIKEGDVIEAFMMEEVERQ